MGLCIKGNSKSERNHRWAVVEWVKYADHGRKVVVLEKEVMGSRESAQVDCAGVSHHSGVQYGGNEMNNS